MLDVDLCRVLRLRRAQGAERRQRVVLMGGAIGLGNVTPAAEFNIGAEAEAARAVCVSTC